jgi:tetratricopeptide (TPR) repeat protein
MATICVPVPSTSRQFDAVARAAADNPRAPPYTRICRALPHWGRGKYSEAADHIEAEVSDELVRPAIEYQQARLNQMAMRMDRALHHYNRVVAAAPWFGCVHHQLAKLRLEAQDLAGAATLLERAMACFTDKAYVTDVELHIVEDLVRLLLTQGKLREAVREVEKIALREPESNRWREWQKQLAFSGWMKCAALYPRLKPNEMMDQTTCKELESLTGVVLGRKSSAWRRWVELGRWLEASVRSDRPVPLPAAFRSNNRSVFAEMEDYAYKNELGGTIERRAPGSVELLASSLVSHQNRCYDGRTWLILGLELDRAGLKKEARLLFREGLSRLPGRSLGLKLPYIYAALTVALDTTPGHDLEREWFQWLLNGEVKWFQSWSGLYFTLDKTKPELLERILVRGAADPVRSEQAYHYLGYYYAQVKGNRPGAERTWLEGIRHFPKSRALALRLIPHYLQTGKLQRAKQFLDRITDEDFYRWACDFVEGDGPRTVPPVPPGFEKDPTCRMLRIQRFLEWDDLKAAETEFQRSRGANETQPGESMCVKMLWAGSALPELDAYLKGGLNWLSMAGQPESTVRNARWIQAAESLFDARGPFFRSINIWWALWLSRRGQTEEAIAVLKRYIDVGLCTPGDVPLIVEILARPHWIRMFRPETPRPAPIPILPFSATSSLADRYLRELEKGALAADAQTAEELRDFSPDADVFTLAAACPIAAGAETAETRRQMEMFRVAARWNQSTWLLRRLAHPFGRNSTLVGTGTP